MYQFYARQIEVQNDRNTFLANEIKKLDKDIADINELRNQIQALLARKQIIETLQADRAQTVHLLEQMVRQMPEGVYLRSMKQSGQKVHIARLRAVERARLDADAQHRGLALARAAAAGRGQVGQRRQARVSDFNLYLNLKRAEAKDAAKARQGRRQGRGEEGLAMAINFNALVEEFKRTNWQDAGTWGAAPKILVLLAILVGVPVAGLLHVQPGPDRGARAGPAQGSEAEGGVRQQEEAGDQPRPAPPAAARDRHPVRRAAQAAAQQVADGRAARRHQPGRARPRPAVRAVQAGRSRDAARVLRRAADRREGDRHLPRHGRVRERRRPALAHRHAEGRQHRRRQGRQPDHGRRSRAPSAISTTTRSPSSARRRRKARRRNERAPDWAAPRHRSPSRSPAAAARSTATSRRSSTSSPRTCAGASTRCRR